MTQNKALEFWNGLPTWAKGTIAVGGVAIVYFAARGIWKQFKSKAEEGKARQTLREQKNELTKLQNVGLRATYPDSQYKSWADRLQKQYDGIDWKNNVFDYEIPVLGTWSGSGKVTAQIVTQLKNNVDFLKLQDAYDVRTYDQAGLFTGDFTGNLTQAINDELDNGEVNALNNILKKNGITYRF
jgi:hypothetical protein